MFKSRSLDRVTEDLEDSIQEGESSNEVSKAFWRAGLRCGKKGMSSDPIEVLIRSAVSAATTRVIEDFLKVRTEKSASRLGLEDRLRNLEDRGDEYPLITLPTLGAPSSEGFEPINVVTLSAPTRNDSKQLSAAATHLGKKRFNDQKQRELEQRRQVDEKGLADAVAAQATREQYLSLLQSLREQVITLDREMSELPGIYDQKFVRVRDHGNVIWSRFCDGFDTGKSRIRKPLRLRKKARERALQLYGLKQAASRPQKLLEISRPTELLVSQ